MKKQLISILILSVIITVSYGSNSGKQKKERQAAKISFIESSTNKKIDVMTDGKLFTSFQWPDDVCKPILYPVCTSAGTVITRGFPINPKTGERNDHPHQIGMWLTYGNVDGFDFWGNGSEGLGTKNANGGVIKHLGIERIKEGDGEGVIVSNESWTDPTGNELLKERTEYHFIAHGSTRMIDRITTLTAVGKDVSMPDTKEGMFGIRLARQLELVLKGDITVIGADGQPTTVNATSDKSITGNYLSSEGISGESVWGKRARWIKLSGNISNEKISLVICDHPKNLNYPTYWHARGYGLFAANPLGVKDFTEKKEILDFRIPAGKSVTFRYRVIINSGTPLTNEEMNASADAFARKF